MPNSFFTSDAQGNIVSRSTYDANTGKVLETIELTEEQKRLVLDEWNNRPDNPPGIKELTEKAFPDVPEELKDGRSKYGRAVKIFLATRKIKAHGAHEHQGRIINLTEENKEFIEKMHNYYDIWDDWTPQTHLEHILKRSINKSNSI